MSASDTYKEAMKNFGKGTGPKIGNAKWLVVGVFALLGLWGAFSLFYTVEPDEEAVILRLGKYHGTYPPGLHFKLPFGVDRMYIVRTQRVFQEEFGFRTSGVSGSRSTYSSQNFKKESLMLTGDLNVADVEWVVQYQISDPFKYLFHSKDPTGNIRDVTMSIMRRVVGDKLVNDVLTVGRVAIANEAKVLIQEVLDRYDIGIRVVTVNLQDVNPPEMVKPSFNEVNAARQEKEKLINEAERNYNKVIPQARGEAEQLVSQAEGYATALIDRSIGDAQKFGALLATYRQAPTVTRNRLYIETMEELFQRFEDVTIVDSNAQGLLPIFQQSLKGN